MTAELGPDASIAEVVRGAQARGRRAVVIPAGSERTGSLAWFAQALELPSWFGHNLDALDEALGDWAAALPGPVTLVWDGVATLADEDPPLVAAILEILHDTESECTRLETVVIRR